MNLENLVAQQNERISQLTEMLAGFLTQKECPQLHNNEEKKKMPYLKEGTLFQRKSDGRWEARLMIDGKQKTIACCIRQEDSYKKLKEAIKDKHKLKKKVKQDDSYTLFSWLDHWFKVYRLPKLEKPKGLSKNTIASDNATIKKIKQVFTNIKLKNITSEYIQSGLNSMTQGRSCESVYTTLNLALTKAVNIIGSNVMALVDKVEYDQETGRALSELEQKAILESSRDKSELDVWMYYLYTGCRPGELHRGKVKHVDLEKNEIFIDGTKNKTSQRSMPIFPQLRPILERLIAGKNMEDKLINKTYGQVRKILEHARKTTGIEFTLKDTRHTCATNCKDAGIPISVYHHWFGWADETMARKVYTHKTQKDNQVSQEWVKKSFSLAE